jgi:phosphoserine phosphatase
LNDSDYLGKVKYVRGIMKEEGVDPNQCVFIGDGPNDAMIGKEVGISISFNGCKPLEEACNYNIRQKEGKENFIEVLKVFGGDVYRDAMKVYKSRLE